VGRFEEPLKVLGLGGFIDDTVRDAIFRLSQVRNVLVHRAGVADRRFIEQAVFATAKIGHEIPLTRKELSLYVLAIFLYVAEVGSRIHTKLALPPGDLQHIRDSYTKHIAEHLRTRTEDSEAASDAHGDLGHRSD
jgi:hypothetical protein